MEPENVPKENSLTPNIRIAFRKPSSNQAIHEREKKRAHKGRSAIRLSSTPSMQVFQTGNLFEEAKPSENVFAFCSFQGLTFYPNDSVFVLKDALRGLLSAG